MLVIGVAGPTGSGKSTVARMLARRPGFAHVDCDELAHATYRPGGPAYLPILARFGEEIRAPDGTVDRARLAELALSNPQAKADLEAIVHPLVMEELRRRLGALCRGGTRVAVVEGALLLSSPHVDHDVFHLFLWLSVPEEERWERLRATGLPQAVIRRRLESQKDLLPPRDPKVVVVDGRGSPGEVVERVLRILEDYRPEAPSNS